MIDYSIKFLCFVFLCMINSYGFVSGEVRCIATEREALLKFKRGLIDDYGDLSSWGSEDDKMECCNWDGVSCSNTTGHVIGLHLGLFSLRGHGSLSGKIDPSILDLHHLISLDLSYNNFSGERIPEFIGSMINLQYLNLGGSDFFGIIPHQLWNLTNLKTLYIWGNSLLRFENSNWLQQVLLLPFLEGLVLSDCSLPDVVPPPESFVNSSSSRLTSLNLSYNGLASAFSWLFNISSNFVSVDLSGNRLTGLIPDAFGKLFSLEFLYLYDNMLEGGIPKSLGNLSLDGLSLSNNYLEQPLVEFFENLCCKAMLSLTNIVLSENSLTGLVPDLSSFLSLDTLRLSNNKLTGSLPSGLAYPIKLSVMDFSYNSMEGAITEANFMNLHNLERLDLSNNSFKLQISPEWNPPFQLAHISVAYCGVGPRFPAWLRSQKSLLELDLSNNNISDEVPDWLWTLSDPGNIINLSGNNIYGTIPNIISTRISVIDISSNNFSGPLPLFHPNTSVLLIAKNKFNGSISPLCNWYEDLSCLDVSNNQFEGVLPNCWQGMEQLGILNLANNFFYGKLPPTLRNCKSLRLFNIQGNKFSGNIPNWIGANYSKMAYMIFSQNKFSGNIPYELCNVTSIQVLDLSGNNISGKIPRCFNEFNSLVKLGLLTSEATVFEDNVFVQWKGQQFMYKTNLKYLQLIDLSSNIIDGSIPKELFALQGLVSLNLSRNCLTGIMDPDISQMERLEVLDISRNQLDGVIPAGMAQLHFLGVVDLSYNNLSGKIPTSTQLQSFNASVYAGNAQLCGPPLAPCPGDGTDSTPKIQGGQRDYYGETENGFMNLSFVQDLGMSMAFGFFSGFWGIVGPLLLMKSWRIIYFRFFGHIGNWLYVKTLLFVAKVRQI